MTNHNIKNPILIASPHNSGSSIVANILINSGVNLGTRLLGKDANHPNGLLEDKDFLYIHRIILHEYKLHYDGWDGIPITSFPDTKLDFIQNLLETRKSSNPWGWKDPRNCLFLSAWEKIITPFYLLIFRNPWDTCQSLIETYNFKQDPLKIWINYASLILERHMNDDNSFLLSLNTFYENQKQCISCINNKWNLNLKLKTPITQNFRSQNIEEKFKSNNNYKQAKILYNKLKKYESSIKPSKKGSKEDKNFNNSEITIQK